MTGGKSGRVFGIDFDRAAGRSATANGSEGVANDSDGVLGTEAGKFHENGSEGVANDNDGVLGTEAGKFHDGPSNLARRNAAANGNITRGEG